MIRAASIAVDLDGTLAKHTPGKFDRNVIGDPVPKMLSRVRRWLKDGEAVKIFTARASDTKNLPPIRKWLKEHGILGAEITNEKTPDIEQIWDDRAVSVELNTGKVVKAAGAARALLRAGQLSEGALSKLRMARMLPSVEGYVAGLERGNQNLIRRYGITDRSAPAALSNRLSIADYYRIKGIPADQQIYQGPVAWAPTEAYGKARLLARSKLTSPADAAITRRHEIDEIRAFLSGKSERNLPVEAYREHVSLPEGSRLLPPIGYGHTGPWVIAQEGQNAAGLSLSDRNFHRRMRGRGYKGYNQGPTYVPSEIEWLRGQGLKEPLGIYSKFYKGASAKGIPSRKDYGDLSQVQEGDLLDYVIQRHLAQRAGPHFDLRMGSPRLGLYSWASRKGVPHEPGEKTLAVRQPLHRFRYRNFEGEIPIGQYGGGTVSKVREGKLLITRSSPNAIHFTEASSPIPRRFILIKPKGQDQNWLLARDQIPEHPGVEKESYKVLQPDEAVSMMDTLMENGVAQPKVDGALAFLRLAKGRAEVVSHRLSKRTGGAIPHTERIFRHVPGLLYPKKFEGRTFKGEIFGERGGKAIPPQELGGILNAGIARSLEKQKEQDVALKMLLFGQGGDQPYDAQRAELEELLGYLPPGKFQLPEDARTVEEASRMLEQIQSGEHPLTVEGMVVHPSAGGTPTKVKFRPERDVFVREVYPGEGKYEGVGAGGFRYSTEPEGPILGNVGSGLSDELRQELLRNPELYFGRRARVAAQGAFPSGALRAPSLIALHEG